MTAKGWSRTLRWPLWSWRNLTISAVAALVMLAALGRLTDSVGASAQPAASEQPATTTSPVVPSAPSTPSLSSSSSMPTVSASTTSRATDETSPVEVATAFVTAWSHGTATEADWLAGMKTWATASLLGSLAGTDPSQVPANRVTGDSALTSSKGGAATVSVPTDGGRVAVDLIRSGNSWKANGLAPDDAPPGAPTPALTASSRTGADMPAPLLVAAGQVARKAVLRRLLRLGLVVLPVAVVAATAVGLLVVLVFASGGADERATQAAGMCSTVSATSTAVAVGSLTAEQLANAQTIVAVGRELQVPPYGWVVAVATALQESSLTNLTRGHLDSIGLFQQRAGWGPEADRLNPQTAARMFYTGGKGGQKGLMQIHGFESLPLTQAAQQVQHSAFPDAYGRWEKTAQQIVSNPAVLSSTCYTDADYTGDGTPGSNAVASALQYLGTPYSWGGGGIGGPGKGFGPGSTTAGFDCSSLVQYAYFKATGKVLPRVTDAQAAVLPKVPLGSKLKAGDLLFFHSPGDPAGSYHHVGIYDGQGGMVHAPRTGKTVEVVHNVLTDPYYRAQLALVARPDVSPDSVQAGAKHG